MNHAYLRFRFQSPYLSLAIVSL